MKKLVAGIFVVVLLLVTAQPVFASPPDIWEGSFTVEEFVVDCADFGDWDYEVWDRYVENYKAIYHYDDEGDWTHINIHLYGDSFLYVPNNSEKEIHSRYSYNWLRYPDPEAQGKGNIYNVVLPGYGNLYKMSGSVWLEGGLPVGFVGIIDADFEAICEYFSS